MNPAYTDSLNELIARFATLPGIGQKTAERLAFHILKTDLESAMALANAIQSVKTNTRQCKLCFSLCDGDLYTV